MLMCVCCKVMLPMCAIQVGLMKALYDTIEGGGVGLMESPTGAGQGGGGA